MTATDMVRFTKLVLPKFSGVVLLWDGKDIGAGCIVWGDENRFYLCLQITDELRARPVFLFKTAKFLIGVATKAGEDLYVIEQADEPTAPRLLKKLGFAPTGEVKDGERVLKFGG